MPTRLPAVIVRRTLALAGVALLAAYLALVLRVLVASRSASSGERASLERAARLEPQNARHPHLLGRHFVFAEYDPQAAIREFRKATALNPHVSRFWLDLANAHHAAGENEKMKQALDRALLADPTTPTVAWEAALLYVVTGHTEDGLRLLPMVLEHDPPVRRQALETAWRVTQDADRLLDHTVPRDNEIYLDLLSVLIDREETAAAAKVWARLMSLRQPFSAQRALPYVDFLTNQRDPRGARQVWIALPAFDPGFRPYLPGENLVINGGFEYPFLEAGFDWRTASRASARRTLDSMVSRGGRRSLRIDLDGAGEADAGLLQFLLVDPDSDYRFRAYVRTEDMESASGPRLEILDAFGGTILLRSRELLGSSEWQLVEGEFRTPPGTELAVFHVVRVPPDSQVRGKLWMDDITLVRKAP